MQTLENFSIKELKLEIQKREEIEELIKFNTLVGDVLPYKHTDSLDQLNYNRFYKVDVEDESEGFEYLIQSKQMISESVLRNIVIDEISKHMDLGISEYNYRITNMTVSEIGRYSLTFLSV